MWVQLLRISTKVFFNIMWYRRIETIFTRVGFFVVLIMENFLNTNDNFVKNVFLVLCVIYSVIAMPAMQLRNSKTFVPQDTINYNLQNAALKINPYHICPLKNFHKPLSKFIARKALNFAMVHSKKVAKQCARLHSIKIDWHY